MLGKFFSGCLTAIGAFIVVFVAGAVIVGLFAAQHESQTPVQAPAVAPSEPAVAPSVSVPSQPAISDEAPKPTADDALRLEPNPLNGTAISDGRTYSVALIDDKKNDIPTGTELFVQGTMLTATWTQTNECMLLMAGRAPVVQHGEMDPSAYCEFSIDLTEKSESGDDLWPGVGLVCHVSPEEMREATRLYHYGDEVQAHGLYSDSLDFSASLPGTHFGIPALDNCTFANPTSDVVRPPH